MKTTDNDDQDGFHDHDSVMIIMLIMMVMTMKKVGDMINGSDYNYQDPVRHNVCDAG